DWDNVASNETAAWIEGNIPPGSPLMSTRLYYSHLYFLTGGSYPIHQLPTTLVSLHSGSPSPLRARSTLFRWEPLPPIERSHWLYLGLFQGKGYYVGLSEEDLIAGIEANDIHYLVFNSSDAVFSSLAYLGYFDANPAFHRIYEREYTAADRTIIYEVDPGALDHVDAPLRVTEPAYAGALPRFTGDMSRLNAALDSLNPAGFATWP
ncbi:MAG TPA: hypothetical protein VH951_04710, partial [Dehalococcoidia bacterium]